METKNESIPKEIVAATAAEPEYEVLGVDLASPEKTEPVDWTQHVATIAVEAAQYVQPCMLCENTRNIGGTWYSPHPWICDECKEAIAYAKEILKHRGEGIFYD